MAEEANTERMAAMVERTAWVEVAAAMGMASPHPPQGVTVGCRINVRRADWKIARVASTLRRQAKRAAIVYSSRR